MELFQVVALFTVLLKVTWSHGGHHDAGKPLEFASEIHNKDHILEHLQNVVSTKPKDQLTDEELEFHYFKLHDYDNNNKLDGVEIGKALTHFHDDSSVAPKPTYSDEELETAVDEALKDDMDGDGYVEYYEFSLSQQMARSANPHLGAGVSGLTEESNRNDMRPPSWNPDEIRSPGFDDDDADEGLPVPVEARHQPPISIRNELPATMHQQVHGQKFQEPNAAQDQQQHPTGRV